MALSPWAARGREHVIDEGRVARGIIDRAWHLNHPFFDFDFDHRIGSGGISVANSPSPFTQTNSAASNLGEVEPMKAGRGTIGMQ